jgi:hypothetical protein
LEACGLGEFLAGDGEGEEEADAEKCTAEGAGVARGDP